MMLKEKARQQEKRSRASTFSAPFQSKVVIEAISTKGLRGFNLYSEIKMQHCCSLYADF